jgi:hypothetical protein
MTAVNLLIIRQWCGYPAARVDFGIRAAYLFPACRPPNGYDWAPRYPLIVEVVNRLKARSCLIDGEAVCWDERRLAMFHALRRRRNDC